MKLTRGKRSGRRCPDQKGFAIISVVFAMVAFLVIGLTVAHQLSVHSRATVENYQSQQAFYVAEGGLQFIIQSEFKNDSDFSDNASPTTAPFGTPSIALSPGEFWAQYSDVTENSAKVTITAKVGNSVRKVQQTVTNSGTNQLPLNYAIYSGGNLNIGGGVGIIDGNISAAGNINGSSDWSVSGTIVSDNPVTLPAVDLGTYSSLTNQTHTGDLTISGNYTGNIYVTGNVTLGAGAAVSGIIVSAGNIEIESGVTVDGTLAAGGDIDSIGDLTSFEAAWAVGPSSQPLPALIAAGNISISVASGGNLVIDGYLFSGGNIHLIAKKNSFATITGFMISTGNTIENNQGTMTVIFDGDLANQLASSQTLALSLWREL